MKSKPSLSAFSIPEPGEGKRGESGYLAYLLRQAAAASRQRLERSLADLGVTSAQFVVLTMLNAYPGATGADVARLALLTPQTVHGIVGNLLAAGLLASQAHPTNARQRRLLVTSKGAELLRRCRARAKTLEVELTEGLSQADEAIIRRWLARFAARSAID